MAHRAGELRSICFGEFLFDPQCLDLRRGGHRIRLREQPLRILALLIARRDAIVTREELHRSLWPADTQLDCDHSLNNAINQLREALEDSAANPKFIETIPRRGYRFIAKIEQSVIVAVEARISHPDENALPAVTPKPAERFAVPAKFFGLRLLWALTAGALVVALLSATVIYNAAYSLKNRKSVVVLGFTNLSGNPADAWLSAGLTNWLATDLTGDGNLRAISREDVARFLAEHDVKSLDGIGSDLTMTMGRDLGSDLVITGSYSSTGTDARSRVRVDVEVLDSRSGRRLFSATADGSRAEIFDLAASAGAQLRAHLRLAPMPAAGLSSMRSLLPTNPDAARFYSEGMDDIERFDPVGARMLLQRAIALEPEHALSHSALSTADTMLGLSADAKNEAEKGVHLEDGLGTEQRLLIEGQYYEANYEWDKAIDAYSRLYHLFPDRVENGVRLVRTQTSAGKPLQALDTIAQLRQLPLSSADLAGVDLAEAEAASAVSDFRRQKEAAERAAALAQESGAILLLARVEEQQGEALRALGNFSDAISVWKDAETRYVAVGDSSAVARLTIDEGRVRRQQGDPQAADAAFSNAASLAREIGDDATLGRALIALAQLRMFSVNSIEGNRLSNQALKIFRAIGNKQEEAYALSIMGDIAADNHEQAIKLYRQSLELSRAVNDRSRIAGRLMDLGIQATVQGKLLDAADYLQDSLAIYHDIGERNREALLLNLLSVVRTWQGRLEEAEKLSSQSVAMLSAIGDAVPLAQSRQNLAIVQMLQGRLAEAESSFDLAMDEHRRANNTGGAAIAAGQLAEVLLLEGNLPACQTALAEYSQQLHTNPSWHGEHIAQALIVAARLYAAEGHATQARSEALRALNEASRSDEGSMMMKARLALGEIDLQNGQAALGHRDLKTLARDADSTGFGLIESKARQALSSQTQER
jgi:DNA-binding winged helix-turn-helix (wHTH) protein/tetratricopeptide (TPR) repeat protein